MNVFAIAARRKYRFDSNRGKLTVEDLYDLNLQTLDTMAVALDEATSDGAPKSFLSGGQGKKTSQQYEDNTNKLAILKAVIETKEAEAAATRAAQDNQVKRNRILEIMAEKQDGELQGKSLEELQKLLENM